MKKRHLFAFVVLVCCSGCGTYGGYMLDSSHPYLGTTMDCKAVAQGHPEWLIDLPFTAVGDTLMLPINLSNMGSHEPSPDSMNNEE